MLESFTKAQIEGYKEQAAGEYAEVVYLLAIALQDGCDDACELRKKAKKLFLIMYALDSVEMDDSGMTANNGLDSEGLGNIVSYLQTNCNCDC